MAALDAIKAQLAIAGPNDPVQVKIGANPLQSITAGEFASALGVTQAAYGSLWVNTDGLRLRATASTGTVLATVNRCDELILLSQTIQELNGYTWANVRVKASGLIGYVATKVIKTGELYCVTKNPCDSAPTRKAGFGFHIFPGSATSRVIQFAAEMKSLNKPLRVCVVVNDRSALPYLLNTVDRVVYRDVLGPGDPDNPTDAEYASKNGAAWVAKLLPRYLAPNSYGPAVDKRCILGLMNEGLYHPDAGQFWLSALRYADSVGYKLGCFAYSIGNPNDEGGTTAEYKWSTLIPALTYARDNNHPVLLHCYSAPGTPPGQMTPEPNRRNWEGRFIRLWNSVPVTAQPRLIFSEVASENARGKFQGNTEAVQYLDSHNSYVRPYDYVDGDAAWTVNGQGMGWEDASINTALPMIEDMIRNRVFL